MARILRVAGIQCDGRVLTIAGVTQAAGKAVEGGLVARVRARRNTFAGTQQAATWLTREAARRGVLEPIRRAHRDEAKSSSRSFRTDWERMEVRCNTASGTFAAIPDGVRDECWSFLAYPDASDLLATLPERFQGPALRTCLSEVIFQAAR